MPDIWPRCATRRHSPSLLTYSNRQVLPQQCLKQSWVSTYKCGRTTHGREVKSSDERIRVAHRCIEVGHASHIACCCSDYVRGTKEHPFLCPSQTYLQAVASCHPSPPPSLGRSKDLPGPSSRSAGECRLCSRRLTLSKLRCMEETLCLCPTAGSEYHETLAAVRRHHAPVEPVGVGAVACLRMEQERNTGTGY